MKKINCLTEAVSAAPFIPISDGFEDKLPQRKKIVITNCSQRTYFRNNF